MLRKLCVDTPADNSSLPHIPPGFQSYAISDGLDHPVCQLNTMSNLVNSTLSGRNHPGRHMGRQSMELLY